MKKAILIGLIAIALMLSGCTVDYFPPTPTDNAIELLNFTYLEDDRIHPKKISTFVLNTVLSAEALAEVTSLKKENICISKGDFETEENFELQTKPAHRLVWNGTTNVEVELFVTCNIDLESLQTGFKNTFIEEWKYDCSICEGQGRCCLIALEKP